MQRQQKSRRKGADVNGWLVLDKPCGLTSTSALNQVKRLFNAKKAGHAGTLDPLATGVLPIAFGEATKTVPFVVDSQKSYIFTVRWGAETDTDDSEGEVTAVSTRRPSREEITAALANFRGEIQQVPPRYSAIKIAGMRAYDRARDGETFEIEARTVEVHRLEITDIPDADTCVLEADCGKGTYVRSLARDLGRLLGCHAHVIALRRTRVGPFSIENALTLEQLEEIHEDGGDEKALWQILAPVQSALAGLPSVALSNAEATRLRQGQAVLLRGRDSPIIRGRAYATLRGTLVALGEVKEGALHAQRVFRLPVRPELK